MGCLFRAAAPLVVCALGMLCADVAQADGEGTNPAETPPAAPPARAPRARSASTAGSASALLPGFETLADGSTRLFVELTQPVSYETKASPGGLTYVLKGARAGKRNNTNPLVTVHFNTPVTSARLTPHGRDLFFVVALRASVQPTVTMDTAKEGGAVLRIEFPKGDYLPAVAAAPAARGAKHEDTAPAASSTDDSSNP
jgi:hypothetical protein